MNREALKARHVDAQGTSIVLEVFFGTSLFRAFSALSCGHRRTRPVGPGYYISRPWRSRQPCKSQD
jgi:hypothetical protein